MVVVAATAVGCGGRDQVEAAGGTGRGSYNWCIGLVGHAFRLVATTRDYEGASRAFRNDLGSTYGERAADAIARIASAVTRGGESTGVTEAAAQTDAVCSDAGFRDALASTDNG